jgi:transcriptional regulator with XRE-family HTH domain
MAYKNQILIGLAARIKGERLKRHLSQEDFAELLGVHRTYVGMLERCERNITLTNLEKIAQALDMESKDLLNFNIKNDET